MLEQTMSVKRKGCPKRHAMEIFAPTKRVAKETKFCCVSHSKRFLSSFVSTLHPRTPHHLFHDHHQGSCCFNCLDRLASFSRSFECHFVRLVPVLLGRFVTSDFIFFLSFVTLNRLRIPTYTAAAYIYSNDIAQHYGFQGNYDEAPPSTALLQQE